MAQCLAQLAPSELDKALNTEVPDYDMDATSSDADDEVQPHGADSQEETEAEAPPQRTVTQLAKQRQVQSVQTRVGELQEPVRRLQAAVESLSKDQPPEDADVSAVETLKAAVDEQRKLARNLGEDLVQDLLSLDKLSGLVPEDRASRKAAIAKIEMLLDDVDAAKSKLSSLDGRVAKLHSSLASKPAPAPEPVEAAAPEVTPERHVPAAREPSAPSKAPRRVREATRSNTARASFFEPALPSAEMWARQELALRLQAREEEGYYIVTVPARGLEPEDVKLQLDDDEENLTVSVRRLPQAHEAAQMQKRVAAHLRELASRSAAHRAQVIESWEDLALQAYAKLGEGLFGTFQKSVELPEDVDVERVQSSCHDGVLRVVLPKRPPARLPRSSAARGYGMEGLPAGRHGYPRQRYARPTAHQGFQHPMFSSFGGFPF